MSGAEMHSGYKWAAKEGLEIVDPTGWPEEGMSPHVQMTWHEYVTRREQSTTRPAWPPDGPCTCDDGYHGRNPFAAPPIDPGCPIHGAGVVGRRAATGQEQS